MRLQSARRCFQTRKGRDKLVTTQFVSTATRGFAGAEEPRVAVCLLPGTEVAFESKVERHLTGFQLRFRKTKAYRIRWRGSGR